MKNLSYYLALIVVLLLGACSAENPDGSLSGPPDSAPLAIAEGKVTHAKSLSNHYVEVTFDDAVAQDSFEASQVLIVSSSGTALAVHRVEFSVDGKKAILQTDPQSETQYLLRYKLQTGKSKAATAGGAALRVSNKGVSSRGVDATYDFIPFNGTLEPEPYIKTIIATTNTTVLVTMSDAMDPLTVELTGDALNRAYRIVSANDARPREDVGDLVVKSAKLDVLNKAQIILNTSEQFDIEYFVTIANVSSAPPAKLIQPLRNKMSFFGINKIDVTGPKLTKAVSTGNTGAMLYFSEPLSNSSAYPLNFTLCAAKFDVSNNCPSGSEFTITAATLTALNTQIQLTTLPQQSGVSYGVKAQNLRDRATPAPGNLQSPNPDITYFTGSGKGAPRVESALAEDNTHVLVKFSERMSADALAGASYRIELPPLDVSSLVQKVDDWTVRLTTTPQERITYKMIARNVQSAEGLLIDSEHNNATFVGQAAKDTEAPKLLGAEAETRTRTRLFFSEPLSETATHATNYSVVIAACPLDDTKCTAGTALTVISAQLDVFDTQVVISTLEAQEPRVQYVVSVGTGVTDKAMPLPHNNFSATANTAKFGILLDDKTAPVLLSANAISTTEIVLNFNESMGDKATDPRNYVVCAAALDANGVCSAASTVQVLSAKLSSAGTQVTLSVLPLKDGTSYIVVVNPRVTDATGNKISSSNASVAFTFAGATTVADSSKPPTVVGAVSTSNTTVTVSFSSIMGSSVLNTQNYFIVQENVNGEVGTVFIRSVEWVDEFDKTAVKITTTAQNEVTYRVTAVNVKDVYGNPLASKRLSATGPTATNTVIFDATSAIFAGSPSTIVTLTLAGNWETSGIKGKIAAGNTITVNGQTIVLADVYADGIVDNWVDSNKNGIIDSGDTVAGLIDSDGDGLSDGEELRGRVVTIKLYTGDVERREVTSDPTLRDTDGDGLTDFEERTSFNSDPRSADSDNDGLGDALEWNVTFSNVTDQDTDHDGLTDGGEHFFFHTSPNLADTDGDQLSDAQELIELSRNPRIADLPNIKIEVGQVKLQIDEKYTYENANGTTVANESSTSTSLSSGTNTSFSNSRETMDEISGGFSAGVTAGFDANDCGDSKGFACLLPKLVALINIEGNYQRTTGTTVQVANESARESQQAYENSLNKGTELSQSSAVTRELSGARISVDLQVENTGNIALTVSNLQVTVLQVDPQRRGKFIPIATLTPEAGDIGIHLGPFNKSKGPYIFVNNAVYPNLVETLMRDPRSLIFKVSNYDISDEYDRNFAFANQVARDRTAGIVFNFGELGGEEYYVATAGTVGDDGKYVGGFGNAGLALPTRLSYLLQNVLGLKKHDTSLDTIVNGHKYNPDIETGIVVGDNKTVDSLAQGDDVQLVPYGTTGVAPRELVIGPGANGVLDTPAQTGDVEEFISGYETQKTCGIGSARSEVGNFCSVAKAACTCTGPERLYRVKAFRHGDFNNSWFVRTNAKVPAAANFDDILVKPGTDVVMSFLQDLDNDGLFAHEEYLLGSVDSSADVLDNSKYGPKIDSVTGRYMAKTTAELLWTGSGKDGIKDSIDSDHDAIGDFAEAKLGWLISRNGELKRVYSNPGQVDSDGDGLWDIQEQDLRSFCAKDVNGNSIDPRKDALCSYKEPVITEATAIIAGHNGKLDSTVGGDDVYALFDSTSPYNSGLLYGTAVILSGENGVINTIKSGDDEYSNSHVNQPATDPMLTDTDSDNVSDGAELYGYAAAMSIIENANPLISETEKLATANGVVTWGIAETVAQGDDVQRMRVNSQTKASMVLITAGANGVLETVPAGNSDTYTPFWFIAPGADRRLDCNKSSSATDTAIAYKPGTELLDPNAPTIWSKSGYAPTLADPSCYTELKDYKPGKDVKLYGRIVTTDPLRRDTDNDRIQDGLEVAVGSDPTIPDGNDFRDSDLDGLADAEEQVQGWIVKIGKQVGYLVRSNPFEADSDHDGLPDYVERDIGTDPNKADTDGDGLNDWREFQSVTRPTNVDVVKQYDDNGDGVIDRTETTKLTLTFSATDYAYMHNLFTGFSLTLNTAAYNTDPLLADSDGDRLTDYAEAVTGYRILETGKTFLGPVILTNPNDPDSDGDGLTDSQERNGVTVKGIKYTTNASNADTDGDGRSDGVELANGGLTSPLVPDALITVAYESIYADNLDRCANSNGWETVPNPDGSNGTQEQPCPKKTNLLWWLYGTGSLDGSANTRAKHLISSSDEFAYLPDGAVKAVATGHASLLDTGVFSSLPSANQPSTVSYQTGLKMEGKICDQFRNAAELDQCGPYFLINKGDRGWADKVNADWGHGGIPGASDNFVVRWTGQIYTQGGDYEFYIHADNGASLKINGGTELLRYKANGRTRNGAIDSADLWKGDGSIVDALTDTLTYSPGWHPIEALHMDETGYADIWMEWRHRANATSAWSNWTHLDSSNYRRSLDNGSLACVGIERDVKQSSYITLARGTDFDTSTTPTLNYVVGQPYTGSAKGSELMIFKKAVQKVGNEYRYYLVTNDSDVTAKEYAETALDLAASRGIVKNLVRSDFDAQLEVPKLDWAKLAQDAMGKYFVLSSAGESLYKQLTNQARYGQQSFVVRKGESVEVSGLLMKVDDMTDLYKCPVGGSDVVAQYGANCTKRFARTFTYDETVATGGSILSLRDLMATTAVAGGGVATGCDIDLTTRISNQ